MTTPEPAALLRDTLGWAVRRLETVDVASPRIDAELLLAHVLRISRRELARELLFGDRSLDSEEHVDFRRCVEQRADRVPLQHLTGVAPFRHIELAVGPGVFVPRPETELLAGWGIERLGSLREHGRQSERLCAVDLCAGSGAIALSLAHELPDVRAIAVEREGSALGWLARNVEALEPSRSSAVEIVDGDATSTRILSKLDGVVDLVLSNPPYIDRAEQVAPEAKLYDPPAALWADDGGLAVLRGVIARAGALLRPGGWLGVEHGETQGAAVRELLVESGWRQVVTHLDLPGRDRFTTARRH